MRAFASLVLIALVLTGADALQAQTTGRYNGTEDANGGVWIVDSQRGTVRFCWVEQFAGRARISCVEE